MAQTHSRIHLSRAQDRQHPLEAGLAGVAFILGMIAAISALWPSAHVLSAWVGAVGVAVALTAQLLSATTNERWFAITGLIAAGLGLAFGLAHGGWV